MRNYTYKIFFINLSILIFVAYLIGLGDSAFTEIYPSKDVFSFLLNSVQYFIFGFCPFDSRAILEEYKYIPFEHDKALPVISNQKMNVYIQEPAKIVKIDEQVRLIDSAKKPLNIPMQEEKSGVIKPVTKGTFIYIEEHKLVALKKLAAERRTSLKELINSAIDKEYF